MFLWKGRARYASWYVWVLCVSFFKSLFFANYPGYLKDTFTERSSSYNLRGNHVLALPSPKTTTWGLHSFSYAASKIWNSLPDTCKTLNFLQIKQEILKHETFSHFIKSVLKSLVILAIWLVLRGAIYSRIALFFCCKVHLFFSQWEWDSKTKQPIWF